ncbi:acyltransferase [Microbacterium lushaniae]|nr:acyltransferase [Microbacterium lushaniae]KAA9152721.1 acyltransferase [Microbacterium lushaniae]
MTAPGHVVTDSLGVPVPNGATAAAQGNGDRRRWAWDVLRVISVVGVVAIHVFAAGVADADQRNSLRWWYAVVMDLGFVWVVPLFVMLSGALLLAPRQHERGTAAFYRRRLLRLAPAFVLWQLFYLAVVWPLVSGEFPSFAEAVTSVLDGRTYTHLYFLWLIVGLYAVAPVLASYLHAAGPRRAAWFAGITLAITAATWSASSIAGYAGSPRPLTLMALTQWLPYVGFFLAGWALRDLRLRAGALWGCAIATVIVIGVVVWQYGTAGSHPVLDALLPVAYPGILVTLATLGVFVTGNSVFGALVPGPAGARVLQAMSDAAFGVFLVHFAVMLAIRQIPAFQDEPTAPLTLTLIWMLTVVLSFLVTLLLLRIPVLRRIV